MPALFPGPGPVHTGESHDWQPQKQLYVGSEDQGVSASVRPGRGSQFPGNSAPLLFVRKHRKLVEVEPAVIVTDTNELRS